MTIDITLEEIASLENLRAALILACKGKKDKKDCGSFLYAHPEIEEWRYWGFNILVDSGLIGPLSESLKNNTWEPSSIRSFQYWSCGKFQTISICDFWPDRVVHHAIKRLIYKDLYKYYNPCQTACIIDRGLSGERGFLIQIKRAINRLKGERIYCFKTDIRKYYPTVKHQVLNKYIENVFSDEGTQNLLKKIISGYKDLNIYDSFNEDHGIPIGFHLSPDFATLLLSPLFYSLKERYGSKILVVNYTDDTIFFFSF